MEQQWSRPGYKPNFSGGTPPPPVMNRSFSPPGQSQTSTPELSHAERLEAQRLSEQAGFDPNTYQVIRREFFANRFCPSMTIRGTSITFNNACINTMEDVIYVQFMINPTELKLAIRPCKEWARDAVRWCTVREDKRKSRQITCKELTERLYELMDWEDPYYYRFQGMKIDHDGEVFYMFDLRASEPDIAKHRDPETGKMVAGPRIIPEEWKTSFGMNYADHQASQKVNLMEGFVTTGINDGPLVTAEIK